MMNHASKPIGFSLLFFISLAINQLRAQEEPPPPPPAIPMDIKVFGRLINGVSNQVITGRFRGNHRDPNSENVKVSGTFVGKRSAGRSVFGNYPAKYKIIGKVNQKTKVDRQNNSKIVLRNSRRLTLNAGTRDQTTIRLRIPIQRSKRGAQRISGSGGIIYDISEFR